MEELPIAEDISQCFDRLSHARKLRLARLRFVVSRIADRVRELQCLHAATALSNPTTALTPSQRSYLARTKGRRVLRSHTRSLSILNYLS
jgi:hypothetical protein